MSHGDDDFPMVSSNMLLTMSSLASSLVNIDCSRLPTIVTSSRRYLLYCSVSLEHIVNNIITSPSNSPATPGKNLHAHLLRTFLNGASGNYVTRKSQIFTTSARCLKHLACHRARVQRSTSPQHIRPQAHYDWCSLGAFIAPWSLFYAQHNMCMYSVVHREPAVVLGASVIEDEPPPYQEPSPDDEKPYTGISFHFFFLRKFDATCMSIVLHVRSRQ